MTDGFDRGAAVTRSLLGYGVIVGAFYLIFGLTLALTREGFDLTEHALSLLTLGDYGWLQTMNLLLSGIMVVVAAVGFRRALGDSGAGTKVAYLIGVYGACLIASAIFGPDPANDFPTPTASTDPTMSGILHLAFGAIGFLGLAAAAVIFARWLAERGDPGPAGRSRLAAGATGVTFLAGAALSAGPVGVLFLWIAVVTGWAWLAWASLRTYRTVPHPDAEKRLQI
jgi:hypothetical protein